MKVMKNCTRKFTEKDLAYLSDMFSWNFEAVKLINHFMNEAKEDEVQEILEAAFDLHYENLNKCISILEGNHLEEEEYKSCKCKHHCELDENNYEDESNEEYDSDDYEEDEEDE